MSFFGSFRPSYRARSENCSRLNSGTFSEYKLVPTRRGIQSPFFNPSSRTKSNPLCRECSGKPSNSVPSDSTTLWVFPKREKDSDVFLTPLLVNTPTFKDRKPSSPVGLPDIARSSSKLNSPLVVGTIVLPTRHFPPPGLTSRIAKAGNRLS